jgi:hypothetical protein
MEAQFSPRWKRLAEEIMHEHNHDRLQKLAYELEEAIWQRQLELADESNCASEKLSLIQATEQLYKIRIEQLGFPDWHDSERSS